MRYLIILMLLMSSVLGYAENSDVIQEEKAVESVDALAEKINQLVKKEAIPGIQLALFDKNGIYWHGEFGDKDIENHQAMTADALMRAGSTTKTFIALTIMQLVEQGKISLDDPISKIAPEININNPWQQTNPVRLIHLLEHTAGLDDMHFRNFYNTAELDISLADAVNRDVNSLTVRWLPGTRHAYSNPGYGILGFIIEKYTNQKYEDYVLAHIIQPLGMDNSSLAFNQSVKNRLSHGYVDGISTPHKEIYLRSAGSLYTTASDLAKLGQFLLTRGNSVQLANINQQTIQSMEKPTTTLAAQAGLEYGYGKAIYQAVRDHRLWFGHNGGIDGFYTSYGYSPEFGQGYALLVNSSSSNSRELLSLITRYLAKDHPAVVAKGVNGIDKSIDGYYRLANSRNQIFAGLDFGLNVLKLVSDGDKLMVKPILGTNETLIHVGDQQFRLEKDFVTNSIYIQQADGSRAVDLEGGYYLAASFLSVWAPIILLGFGLLMLLLTTFYIPIWLFNLARGKIAEKNRLLLRLLPAMSVLSIALLVLAIMNLSLVESGQINWQTISIFIATITFALFAVISLWHHVYYRKDEPKKLARYFSMASSLAIVLLSGYFWNFNYIGLSLWSW